MRYVFAGDRQISCDILTFLIQKGHKPLALLVTEGQKSTHSEELVKISGLDEAFVFKGKNAIKDEKTLEFLSSLDIDYVFGIHYPYLISNKLLEMPKIGFLNLHPAFLPYNKGWNTPSWAIMDDTIYGATLHFMSEKLDEGDIIHQKSIKIESFDTANSLYKKVLNLEKEVFFESFDSLVSLKPNRVKQKGKGTSYKKSDLQKIREIKLDDKIVVKDFLNKVRAHTTNNDDELAYYFEDDKKIGVRIEFITLEDIDFNPLKNQ